MASPAGSYERDDALGGLLPLRATARGLPFRALTTTCPPPVASARPLRVSCRSGGCGFDSVWQGQPMRIFVSAGEPSGDLHGASLIRALRQARPDVEVVG